MLIHLPSKTSKSRPPICQLFPHPSPFRSSSGPPRRSSASTTFAREPSTISPPVSSVFGRDVGGGGMSQYFYDIKKLLFYYYFFFPLLTKKKIINCHSYFFLFCWVGICYHYLLSNIPFLSSPHPTGAGEGLRQWREQMQFWETMAETWAIPIYFQNIASHLYPPPTWSAFLFHKLANFTWWDAVLQRRLAWALFCCYQPLCVVSQQSWFEFFFFSSINFPFLLPPPHTHTCIDRLVSAMPRMMSSMAPTSSGLSTMIISPILVGGAILFWIGGGGLHGQNRALVRVQATNHCGQHNDSTADNCFGIVLIVFLIVLYLYQSTPPTRCTRTGRPSWFALPTPPKSKTPLEPRLVQLWTLSIPPGTLFAPQPPPPLFVPQFTYQPSCDS